MSTQLSPAEPAGTPLSASEQALCTRAPVKRPPCILETDATLRFGGREIECTLRAYGRFHPFYPGDSGGRGERRLSPPEPAGFSIDSVTVSSGGQEEDIYCALTEADLAVIAEEAAENSDE